MSKSFTGLLKRSHFLLASKQFLQSFRIKCIKWIRCIFKTLKRFIFCLKICSNGYLSYYWIIIFCFTRISTIKNINISSIVFTVNLLMNALLRSILPNLTVILLYLFVLTTVLLSITLKKFLRFLTIINLISIDSNLRKTSFIKTIISCFLSLYLLIIQFYGNHFLFKKLNELFDRWFRKNLKDSICLV